MKYHLNSWLLSLILMACSLSFSPASFAQIDVYEFETTEQEQRFRQLSNEFRCPMCQNANLSSSPGGVAADLRREIYRMIVEGQTDAEIEQFMLSRYGDFVLYRPRLTMQTILLWFGPALFLLIGGWVAWNIIRRSAGESAGGNAGSNAAPNARSNDKSAGAVNSAPNDAIDDYPTPVVISPEERKRLNRLLAAASPSPKTDNS